MKNGSSEVALGGVGFSGGGIVGVGFIVRGAKWSRA